MATAANVSVYGQEPPRPADFAGRVSIVGALVLGLRAVPRAVLFVLAVAPAGAVVMGVNIGFLALMGEFMAIDRRISVGELLGFNLMVVWAFTVGWIAISVMTARIALGALQHEHRNPVGLLGAAVRRVPAAYASGSAFIALTMVVVLVATLLGSFLPDTAGLVFLLMLAFLLASCAVFFPFLVAEARPAAFATALEPGVALFPVALLSFALRYAVAWLIIRAAGVVAFGNRREVLALDLAERWWVIALGVAAALVVTELVQACIAGAFYLRRYPPGLQPGPIGGRRATSQSRRPSTPSPSAAWSAPQGTPAWNPTAAGAPRPTAAAPSRRSGWSVTNSGSDGTGGWWVDRAAPAPGTVGPAPLGAVAPASSPPAHGPAGAHPSGAGGNGDPSGLPVVHLGGPTDPGPGVPIAEPPPGAIPF